MLPKYIRCFNFVFHIRQSSFGASFIAWLIWHNRSFCKTDCSWAIAASSCNHSSNITAANEYCLTSRSKRYNNFNNLVNRIKFYLIIISILIMNSFIWNVPIISASGLDADDSRNFELVETRLALLAGDELTSVDGLFWGEDVLLPPSALDFFIPNIDEKALLIVFLVFRASWPKKWSWWFNKFAKRTWKS